MRKTKSTLPHLSLAAVFTALITVFTAYIGHIPMPGNLGYLHFGDALIFLAACLLPKPWAMAAGALGGGLADILTYPAYTLPTVIIKAMLPLAFSARRQKILCPQNLLALLPALLVSAAGYLTAQLILFRAEEAAAFGLVLQSLGGSLAQWAGSAVLFALLALALDKASLKKRFEGMKNRA
ncbi:MAG: TIGR04002 family protein [Oscillospiraceae bacterium]|jgi:uncharacterized repeat protein (TIGR04002 family)|nr:TIGR04002 family protein [Oscillospiraceae bacterium]